MTPDRWEKVESLFHAALALPGDARQAFLAQACAGDDELHSQVAALLSHDRTDTGFIETPAIQVAARRLAHSGESEIPTLPRGERDSADTPGSHGVAADALPPGSLAGHFRVVRKIGEGGMGEVYLAEDLKLGRRVALKLLPSALAPDAHARRRFLREANAASALHHPHIVTIFNIEEAEGLTFIVMEYIEGESLRERLARGPMTLAETAKMGAEVAEAIGAAHSINIVHRDLKPGNILLAADGRTKIVDFGLAKVVRAESGENGEPVSGDHRRESREMENTAVRALRAPPSALYSFSQAGEISGTIPYMSPEQTRGEHLDARSDIFSLGCVLYEAATGQRPFRGGDAAETIRQIRNADPRPPSAVNLRLPRGFDRIVLRALEKTKEDRYAAAYELAGALRRLSRSQALWRLTKRWGAPAAAVLALLVAVAAWAIWRQSKVRWARENLPRIAELADAEKFFEAYDLAESVEPYLPEDEPTLQEWKPFVTDVLSVTTDPPGASVSLRRFQRDATGEFLPWEFVGTTPINDREIARGEYLLRIEKEGYAPVQRSLSNALYRLENGIWIPGAIRWADARQTTEGTYEIVADSDAPINIHIKLIDSDQAPPGMVFVPGGEYTLVAAGRPEEDPVKLDDFFIDKCEVSNRQYQEFVDAGGYGNRALWRHPFLVVDKDSHAPREISWEEAMALLTDATGKPGPRFRKNQRFPAELGEHPVTGVSWYEAAAYAAFRGKSLPTIFQWEKAARDGQRTLLWGTVMPWGMTGVKPELQDRANFNSSGTAPVESFEFGVSPYGCYHMAGNVTEWCLNSRPSGFTATGASFREGPHLFALVGQLPGFYRSDNVGFRCVLNSPETHSDQGGMALSEPDEVPTYTPGTREQYELMRAHYQYDPTPLEAEIVEEVETEHWQRLKISYVGAAGQEAETRVPDAKRASAFLWLPKGSPRPLQVVNYKPGGGSYAGLSAAQETEVACKPFILAGRAVFVVVIEGMTDRPLPTDWQTPEPGTVAYRDMIARDTIDQRRGLDYLATRDDIDMDKIVCMGLSMGAYDIVTMAVEERFRGTFLLAAGIASVAKNNVIIPEANPVNFAPYIPGPKLMIQGRYDEGIPFETSAMPLFDLLSEPKELIVLESGHFPPMDQWVPPALKWLDETLGPVTPGTDAASEAATQDR